jgi:hypothetical protein
VLRSQVLLRQSPTPLPTMPFTLSRNSALAMLRCHRTILLTTRLSEGVSMHTLDVDVMDRRTTSDRFDIAQYIITSLKLETLVSLLSL